MKTQVILLSSIVCSLKKKSSLTKFQIGFSCSSSWLLSESISLSFFLVRFGLPIASSSLVVLRTMAWLYIVINCFLVLCICANESSSDNWLTVEGFGEIFRLFWVEVPRVRLLATCCSSFESLLRLAALCNWIKCLIYHNYRHWIDLLTVEGESSSSSVTSGSIGWTGGSS